MVYTDEKGKEVSRVNITDDVDFNGNNPAETYEEDNKTFRYDVQVYLEGKALKDKNGENVTVIAFIGVKGDTNLDNIANAIDASYVLTYYAKIQTGSVPEETKLGHDDPYLDNLSAFLSDVDTNEYSPENWSVEKTSANNNNGKRTVNASDSSFILTYYAIRQTERDRESRDIWKQVVGADNIIDLE